MLAELASQILFVSTVTTQEVVSFAQNAVRALTEQKLAAVFATSGVEPAEVWKPLTVSAATKAFKL